MRKQHHDIKTHRQRRRERLEDHPQQAANNSELTALYELRHQYHVADDATRRQLRQELDEMESKFKRAHAMPQLSREQKLRNRAEKGTYIKPSRRRYLAAS